MVSRDQQYANAYLNGKAEYLFVWCMDQMIARHRMIISWVNDHGSVEDSIYMTTHEIGHVFGLLHEHQRDDRKFASSADESHVCETTNIMSLGDLYVKVQCENLYGYDDVVAELPKHPGLSLEELCNSPVRSFEDPWHSFGFHATEYSVHPRWEPAHRDKNGVPDGARHPWATSMSKSYDKNSIMHYWSFVDVKPGVNWGSATVHNVPLIAWRRHGKDYTPLIRSRTRIRS
jgi:hypothetical protein